LNFNTDTNRQLLCITLKHSGILGFLVIFGHENACQGDHLLPSSSIFGCCDASSNGSNWTFSTSVKSAIWSVRFPARTQLFCCVFYCKTKKSIFQFPLIAPYKFFLTYRFLIFEISHEAAEEFQTIKKKPNIDTYCFYSITTARYITCYFRTYGNGC